MGFILFLCVIKIKQKLSPSLQETIEKSFIYIREKPSTFSDKSKYINEALRLQLKGNVKTVKYNEDDLRKELGSYEPLVMDRLLDFCYRQYLQAKIDMSKTYTKDSQAHFGWYFHGEPGTGITGMHHQYLHLLANPTFDASC